MSINEPWIILLWGAPATGKSTLARKIATEYKNRTGQNLCHLGTDRLNHAVLGDAYDGDIRASLYEGVLVLAESLLRSERPVLLEGTFLKAEWRRRVKDLARDTQARLLSVQIECRLGLSSQRNLGRSQPDLVPASYLERSHCEARALRAEADFVFDTELVRADSLAPFLLGELGRFVTRS
jgi:predicted kinase